MASERYTIKPVAMDNIVPLGMDFFGSFRSPDIATPAVNPVTAGKNIANRLNHPLSVFSDSKTGSTGAVFDQSPAKMDTKDRAIAAKMKN